MIKTALLTALATLLHSAAIADELPADEVIAEINSSGWAVDPSDFGMSAMDYQRKEADIFAQNMINRSGLNEFYHFQGLTTAADTWVVTPNVDTVYSIAVIDARDGFAIELPDVGERFISLHVQDQNHTFVAYSWDTGLHNFPAGSIETDYVIVSTNRDAFVKNNDCSFTVIFGGRNCQALAEESGVNYAQTPEDGWRGQIRAYRPDVEAMKAYQLPMLQDVATP